MYSFKFFLAIFRTVRVSRVRNRALYHSDGFGLFVEIESMSRLFLFGVAFVMVSRTYCHEEYKSVPVFFFFFFFFPPILTYLRSKVCLPKPCFVRQTTSSPLIFLPPLDISNQPYRLHVLKSAQTTRTPKFPYSYVNWVDDTGRGDSSLQICNTTGEMGRLLTTYVYHRLLLLPKATHEMDEILIAAPSSVDLGGSNS